MTKKEEKRERTKKFKEWTNSVKDRDSKQCAICGKEKMLNAHHIIPREDHQLRFDVHNGISLCPSHHKFSFENSPHKNPFVFLIWLKENRPGQYEYLETWLKRKK